LLSPLQSQSCFGKTANLHLFCRSAGADHSRLKGKAQL